MEPVLCAFCGKSTTPKPTSANGLIKYRCEECGSLVAVYASEYDEQLRFGGIFDKYPLGKYVPKPPPYVKRIDPRSESK